MADDNNIIGIDKMIEKFKSEAELKIYCNIQFKTITKLNKSVREKDEEITHLKELFAKSTPLLSNDSGILTETTDEEQICRTQLRRLRDVSMTRELTLEESKKAEIFVKLLKGQIQVKEEKDETAVKNMTQAELIELVKDNGQ